MALKPKDALDAARSIWAGPRLKEAERLNYIAAAVNPRRAYASLLEQPWTAIGNGAPTVEMPKDAPQVMKNLAWKARTNFLPLILNTFSQQIKADGYIEANGKASTVWDRYWQPNGLDARQTGIHYSALQFGASYASILPGDKAPVIKGYSPRRMTAVYQDPDIDEWPMMALDVNGPMMRLFDETRVYRIGIEQYPISGLGAALTLNTGQQFVFLDSYEHGLDFCPVARFRDRMLLDGEEQFGIVEPIIDIQRRVDETSFGMLVAQYYQAFKQRYVVGWIPQSEQEYLSTAAKDFWSFKYPDVKVGNLDGGDLSPYIESKNSALADMAAIAQVSAASLGNGGTAPRNVGPEAVASMDAGGDRRGGEMKTSLGETWELVLRTAALIDGDTEAATDTSSQIRWRDMTTTSPGAIVDALGKMQQMLGIPAEMLWGRIPGWTDQDQARAEALIESGDSLDKLMVTLNKTTQPQDPAVASSVGG